MTYRSSVEDFPGSGLTEADQEQANEFLSSTTAAGMQEWADKHTEVLKLKNGQEFSMIVDRPEEGDSNQAVIVGGEFGNGITPWAVARARVVRDTVAPEATLIYEPNTMIDQSNRNFSRAERRELRRGRLSPVLGRLAATLSSVGSPENLTFWGPSQGGAVSLAYAAGLEIPAAVAVTETTTVADRTTFQMMRDFLGSAKQLKEVIPSNYEHPETTVFAQETIAALGVVGTMRYMAGLLHRDNLAFSGVLRRGSAEGHIKQILENGGSVVQAFGTEEAVSPLVDNERLARLFESNPRYRSVRLNGKDHSITNQYPLSGALARTARDLRDAA